MRASPSRNAGYIPLGDYDNLPNKSFTTPFDPAAAAAVTSKAGCAALSTTGINSRLNCYAQWEDFVPLPAAGASAQIRPAHPRSRRARTGG